MERRRDALGRRCTTRSRRRWATSTDPGALRSRAYDLVVDGSELGGGSIRIHDPEVQPQVFEILGIDAEEAQARFGFLLDALRYGAPPHGGIAMGLDRIVAIIAGRDSIRDVIAFPKTASGGDPLTGAPAPVDERQLRELGLRPGVGGARAAAPVAGALQPSGHQPDPGPHGLVDAGLRGAHARGAAHRHGAPLAGQPVPPR